MATSQEKADRFKRVAENRTNKIIQSDTIVRKLQQTVQTMSIVRKM